MHIVSVREFRKRIRHFLQASEPIVVMRYSKPIAVVFPKPERTLGKKVASSLSQTIALELRSMVLKQAWHQ